MNFYIIKRKVVIKMKRREKSKDSLLLESCFKEIQIKKQVDTNVKTIERVLQRMFDNKFHVSILEYNVMTHTEFFGMCIYPKDAVIDKIITKILNEESKASDICELWKECDEWTVEIDGALLYDHKLNANAQEVVAALMHEIGHTIYANTVPQRLNSCIRMGVLQASYSVRTLCANSKIQKLFRIAVVGACQSKNYHYVNARPEFEADKFAFMMGYGEDLDSLISKLITSESSSLVNKSEKEIDIETSSLVTWTIENIGALEIRKTKLKQLLDANYRRTPSKVFKDCLKGLRELFFGEDEGSMMKEALKETAIVNLCEVVVVSAIKNKLKYGKLTKLKPMDVDVIKVEADRIETYDDKLYVLSLLYDKLVICDLALSFFEQGKPEKCPQPKSTYEKYKKELEEIREKVLKMSLPAPEYGLFIKKPTAEEY